MDGLDGIRPELAKLLAAKEERRQRLSRLPFPEKVQVVVQLQQIAATILRARGKSVRPWTSSRKGV
jgi:hypothetical protein